MLIKPGNGIKIGIYMAKILPTQDSALNLVFFKQILLEVSCESGADV